eukprot:gene23337-16000_t
MQVNPSAIGPLMGRDGGKGGVCGGAGVTIALCGPGGGNFTFVRANALQEEGGCEPVYKEDYTQGDAAPRFWHHLPHVDIVYFMSGLHLTRWNDTRYLQHFVEFATR